MIVSIGAMAAACLGAAAAATGFGFDPAVVDPRWIYPIDPALVAAAADYRCVVTVEDGGRHGGYGDSLARALRAAGVVTPVRSMALDQAFVTHGARGAILSERGLDATGIAAAVRDLVTAALETA
jgi:1-deoxy-D-xylulose-5-phosphate synthase